jgi:hypothetical protein
MKKLASLSVIDDERINKKIKSSQEQMVNNYS